MAKLFIYCDNQLIDGDLLASAVYKTLKQKINLSAEITFCTEEEIKQINLSERKINSVTDVLSFPSLDLTAGEIVKRRNYPYDVDPESNSVFLGCIIICTQRAKEQAEQFGHSFEREIHYLAVHGLLHLFGYDHENEQDKQVMRELEEQILNALGQIRD
ncbi:MAG: rRNA maturation RNase YbeY [Clostridia bacterium]|nr:rRNA maturation RNase YbeY [Clostridia bacterium]